MKSFSGIILALLIISILNLTSTVQPVQASSTIYIRADGRIDPPSAPINTDDNVTYTFTGDINDSIVVKRDNIIIDGMGHLLQGTGSWFDSGVDLSNRANVTVKGLQITNFTHGIRLHLTTNCLIAGNSIAANNEYGIWLDYSSNNIITGNSIAANNRAGIYLIYSLNNSIIENDITANKRDGIYLSDSSNNSMSRNNIMGNDRRGVYIVGTRTFSNRNMICGNNITANNIGIYLHSSHNNSICGNNITNNWYGIWIYYSSSNNSISGNNIANNDLDGVQLFSSNNRFYHNNFIDNTLMQAHSDGHANMWDVGYPSGGNYWSNYNGTDFNGGPYQNETGSDGIGDIPYPVDENNTDSYPLMGLFSSFSATPEHQVGTICNSTISNFRFDGSEISFNVTGEKGTTTGFCRILVPTALMNKTYRVFVNEIEVPHDLLPFSNSTHSYLYFTYNHSTQEVTIIPELPSLFSLPLFMIATLTAITFYRKRTK